MEGNQQSLRQSPRCTLCPAGCELGLAQAGPDRWRSEYSLRDSGGLCARGSAIGELLGHARRIRTAACRTAGRAETLPLEAALRKCLSAADDKEIIILLDGNVPCEQMRTAAAWCNDWPKAQLCFAIEPADEQLLLGVEASGADYLAGEDLAECDAFLIIGDVFAANPTCSRGLLDRRKANARTPVVVIDPAGGSAAKFATHRVRVDPGMEFAALASIASAVGVETQMGAGQAIDAAAEAAGTIAGSKRLGVLIAAEYGRAAPWRQIGYLAGMLAKAKGGSVAPQTAGANALAAVRLAAKLGTISLAKAVADPSAARVVVGCDILGMLGRSDLAILAAAAPLPNRTTAAAEFVLPVAMAGEMAGTYLLQGARSVEVAPLLAPPAGVPSPAELIGALAAEAGVAKPSAAPDASPPQRIELPAPAAPAGPQESPTPPALLLARSAIHAGCGALTGHGSWQRTVEETPTLRVSPAWAEKMNLANLAIVNVRVGDGSLQARVRIAPELQGQAVVLAEGLPQARALMPSRIDIETDAVVSAPAAVNVSC